MPNSSPRSVLLWALGLFALGFAVRSLYAVDLAPSMYARGQPSLRMAIRYDETALSILRGDGILFPAKPDPEDTAPLARPPAYSALLALVYRVAGRSFFEVQLLQNVINSLLPVFVFLLGSRFLSPWAAGTAGILAALSPHLGFLSNFVLPDALCPLVLVLAVLSLTARVNPLARAALCGLLIGAAAWLRPNMVLLGPCLAVSFALWERLKGRALLAALLLPLASLVVILPITVRNYWIYGEFVPLSINGGLTLWEGIADAGGQKWGPRRGDKQVIEEEAVRYRNPRYAEWWASPDGIRRDRDRYRRSLEIIRAHPAWYARAMLRRMARMLDYALEPPPLLAASPTAGSAAVEEASDEGGPDPESFREKGGPSPLLSDRACLAPGRILGFLRRPLRLAQAGARIVLPIGTLLGAALLAWRDGRGALLLLTVPLYCLATESMMLLEWRVVAAMHPFLFVCAASLFDFRFRR